jgi:cbb3-type cytochrome oxidase subunit 3
LWVLSPLWISFALGLLILTILLICVLFSAIFLGGSKKW